MDDPGIEFAAIIVGGIGFGALFAAVDAGLTALGEVGLRAVADEQGRDADTAARALRDRSKIRARLLAGVVLSVSVSVALGVYWALTIDGVGGAVAAALLVALAYAFSAEVATTVARQRASRAALRTLRYLRPVEWLLIPLAWPLEAVGRVTARLVPPVEPSDSERITELTVEHAIEQGEERGSIAEDQAELLRSVLEFRNTVAREIMIPRTQMVSFEITKRLEEVLEEVLESGHSRYPVYRGRLDQMEGVLYAKDLFKVFLDGGVENVRLEQLIRKPVFFAPEAQKIGVLLREMQARRVHLAVVVDEFGGTSGVLTLEDILEEIVGEIQDEHDEEEILVEELAAGRYAVDAGISVYDLEDVLGAPLAIVQEGEYDTLGGLIVAVAGKVPEVGESIRIDGFDVLVREADERHVTRVELVRRETTGDDAQAAE